MSRYPLPAAPVYLAHPLNGHVCLDIDETIAYYEEHFEEEDARGVLRYLRAIKAAALVSKPVEGDE